MVIDKVESYNPSQEIKDFTFQAYKEFQYCLELRRQTYPEFDDLTPDAFWNEARKRTKNYLPPKPLEQELASVFIGKTRNKRNVIAAFVAAQRPRANIIVHGGEKARKTDKRLATTIRAAYDWSMDKEDADEKYLDLAIEALDVGTALLQEDYDFRVREVKLVQEEDFGTGEKKWKKELRVYKDQCKSDIVPIEDLYIQNFYEPDIQEQPPFFIKEYLPRIIAEQRYRHYPNWKYVPYGMPTQFDDNKEETFFFKLLNDRVGNEYVEILYRTDKFNDNASIFANGILLTELDNPIKFDHKGANLVKTVNEKISSKFFYGMPLAMKIVSEQDAFNEITNNNLNRSRISSIPKAVSDYETELEQSSVASFDIIQSSPEANLRELRFDSVKPGDMQFMQFLAEMMDEATVSKTFSGAIAGVTASEIMNNRAQNIQNLGQFLTYLYRAAKQHAELRVQNLLQYFFMTSKKYNGKDFDTKEISVKAKLQDGTEGTRIIRVLSNREKITQEMKDKDRERGKIKVKDPITGAVIDEKIDDVYDYIYITPEEIADISFSIDIIPGSSLPETEALQKALVLELVTAMSQPQFANLTDFSKLQRMVIEKFGYSIDDIRPDQAPGEEARGQDIAQMQQANGMLPQGGEGDSQNSRLVQQISGTGKQGLQQLMQA